MGGAFRVFIGIDIALGVAHKRAISFSGLFDVGAWAHPLRLVAAEG